MYLNQKYIIEPLESLLPIKNISMDIYLPEMVSSKDSLDTKLNSETESTQGLVSSIDSLELNTDLETDFTQKEMVSSKDSLNLNSEANLTQDLIKNAASDLPTNSVLDIEKLKDSSTADNLDQLETAKKLENVIVTDESLN